MTIGEWQILLGDALFCHGLSDIQLFSSDSWQAHGLAMHSCTVSEACCPHCVPAFAEWERGVMCTAAGVLGAGAAAGRLCQQEAGSAAVQQAESLDQAGHHCHPAQVWWVSAELSLCCRLPAAHCDASISVCQPCCSVQRSMDKGMPVQELSSAKSESFVTGLALLVAEVPFDNLICTPAPRLSGTWLCAVVSCVQSQGLQQLWPAQSTCLDEHEAQ